MVDNKKIRKSLSQEERINLIKDEKKRELFRSMLTPRDSSNKK